MAFVLNRGFGSTIASDVQIGGSLAASGGTAILGSIAASGGSILGLTGAALTAAIPVVGAVIAGVTLALQYLITNSGCGQTCIETSSWANQVAAQLDKNIAAYFSLPTPRPLSAQTLALANFDSSWAQLQQLCGQAGTGDAGVRCITDRQAGACTWKQTADKVPSWGTPPVGACWNWFNGYRDPIANDTNVYNDAAVSSAASTGTTITPGASSQSPSTVGVSPVWLAVGAAALLGLAATS